MSYKSKSHRNLLRVHKFTKVIFTIKFHIIVYNTNISQE